MGWGRWACGDAVQVRAAVGRGGAAGAAGRVPARAGGAGGAAPHVGAAGRPGRALRAPSTHRARQILLVTCLSTFITSPED